MLSFKFVSRFIRAYNIYDSLLLQYRYPESKIDKLLFTRTRITSLKIKLIRSSFASFATLRFANSQTRQKIILGIGILVLKLNH